MPYGVPKSGCRLPGPIELTQAADRACTGYAEMSVFHGLSAGKTEHDDGGGAELGENVKMPPSDATNQYPAPGEDAMPRMGLLSRRLPVEPKKRAEPKEKMPPSD